MDYKSKDILYFHLLKGFMISISDTKKSMLGSLFRAKLVVLFISTGCPSSLDQASYLPLQDHTSGFPVLKGILYFERPEWDSILRLLGSNHSDITGEETHCKAYFLGVFFSLIIYQQTCYQ